MAVRHRWQALLAAPALAAGLAASSATLAPAASAGSELPTQFQLTRSAGPSPASPGQAVSLGCLPPRGTHPTPAAACADIRQAGGNFHKLPGDPDIDLCPAIYDPVSVTAGGMFRGEPVRYHETFSNACDLQAETGPVLQF